MIEEMAQKTIDCLGEQIKTARLRAGITQEELAEKLNVSRSSIARYEKGELVPKTKTLISISLLLQVSLDSLAGTAQKESWLNAVSEEAKAALERFVKEIIRQYGGKRAGFRTRKSTGGEEDA